MWKLTYKYKSNVTVFLHLFLCSGKKKHIKDIILTTKAVSRSHNTFERLDIFICTFIRLYLHLLSIFTFPSTLVGLFYLLNCKDY